MAGLFRSLLQSRASGFCFLILFHREQRADIADHCFYSNNNFFSLNCWFKWEFLYIFDEKMPLININFNIILIDYHL